MIDFLLDNAKEGALLLFAGLFLIIIFSLFRPGSTAAMKEHARIPLEDNDV